MKFEEGEDSGVVIAYRARLASRSYVVTGFGQEFYHRRGYGRNGYADGSEAEASEAGMTLKSF